LFVCCLLLASGVGWAQTPPAFRSTDVEPGIVRLKLTESFATQMEASPLRYTSSQVVQTGVTAFDQVHRQFQARQMKRVFPDAGKFEAKHRKHGLHLWYEVQVDQKTSLQSALSAYQRLAQVQYAEPVHKKQLVQPHPKDRKPVVLESGKGTQPLATMGTPASNDPHLSKQWHYYNTGQGGGKPGADISLTKGWQIETGKKEVIVAITDGGVDVNHPDLKANLWVNEKEIPGNGKDDDGNGYVDDVHGYSFVENKGAITPHSHGTHVAGTVAATNNNGIGIAGVAGGSGKGDGVRVMSCAVFTGETPQTEDAGGFEYTYIYAADNGAVISQNSWGYRLPNLVDEAVLTAIDYFIAEAGTDEKGNQTGPMKGGIVIFSAGNDNADGKWYPGYYAPTLAVAATGYTDAKASYSNYGTWVDIAAPGGDEIASGGPEGLVLSTFPGGQYAWNAGTSMACPHVSGVAALVVSKFGGPGYTAEQLRTRLLTSVDNIAAENPNYSGTIGVGRLNAFHALFSPNADDHTAPEAISDLTVNASNTNWLTLTWTAPADAEQNSASYYELRYSTSPITAESFEQATRPASQPKPGAAGAAEQFTLTGLSHEQTYYVAIRSSDYSGNVSGISNVVQGQTDLGPKLILKPEMVYVEMLPTDSTASPLVIANEGAGELKYTISSTGYWADYKFISVSRDSGTVAPGQQDTLWVVFKGEKMYPGEYDETFILRSNDPLRPEVQVPVKAKVLDTPPVVILDKDSIGFGPQYQGVSSYANIKIQNVGTNMLQVFRAESNHPDFRVLQTDTLQFFSFGEQVILVEFRPSSLDTIRGTLRLHTNDPNLPVVTLPLTGEGVAVPALSVTPDSLAASLRTNETTSRSLTLKNTGAGQLHYYVRAQTPTSTTVAAPADTARVLVLTPDDASLDFPYLLSDYPEIKLDVYPFTQLYLIKLADLTKYQAVIVSNRDSWVWRGRVSPEKIGDLLADYVDAGGKVIVNQLGNSGYNNDFSFRLAGRFADAQYNPFVSNTTNFGAQVSLGEVLLPGHPLLEGIDSLTYSGNSQEVLLAPGTAGIAKWDNGDWLVAAKANVVALNLQPMGQLGLPTDHWSGDLPKLYHNAIHWLLGASRIRTTPAEGTLTPGAETNLDVQLSAVGLATGAYEAGLTIVTDVPGQEHTLVPIHLNVAGPDFALLGGPLSDTLKKGEKATHQLKLRNNGTEAYSYAVSVKNTRRVIVDQGADSLTAGPASTQRFVMGNWTPGTDANGKPLVLLNDTQASTLETGIPVVKLPSRYETTFEGFQLRGAHGQEDWVELRNQPRDMKIEDFWVIDTLQPVSGRQHLVTTSVGSEYAYYSGLTSTVISPIIATGSLPMASTSLNMKIVGSGSTFNVVPLAAMGSRIMEVTFVQFRGDGTVGVYNVQNGHQVFTPLPHKAPAGYFALAIEVERATGVFSVYLNAERVYTGQGPVGDINAIGFQYYNETKGTQVLIDDVVLQDGGYQALPPYLSVYPESGILAPGEELELRAEVNSSAVDFGQYQSDLVVEVAGGVQSFAVPSSLTVTGDPAIAVTPTVLQRTLDYRSADTTFFEIRNTGGSALNYQLQLLGGNTESDTTKVGPQSIFGSTGQQQRVTRKAAQDRQLSHESLLITDTLQEVLTGKVLLQENFEGAFPPKGWSSQGWNSARSFGEGNYAGQGEAATLSADALGKTDVKGAIYSPVISLKNSRAITLQYLANYQNYANRDYLDLDIRVNGAEQWTNVLHWQEDHGTLRGAGELVKVELARYLQNAATFQLRWNYAGSGSEGWYTQLDNVELLEEAQPWLTISPVSGSIEAGQVRAVKAYFNAAQVEPGKYLAGIVVNSNAANSPQVGVVATMEVLAPAQIAVTPDSLVGQVFFGDSTEVDFRVYNHGKSTLHVAFDSTSAAWMRPELMNLHIAPGTYSHGLLTMDATGLAPGVYHDTLFVISNDPLTPRLGVPVSLTVMAPIIHVNPAQIADTIRVGEMGTATLTVSNSGSQTGFSVNGSVSWISFEPAGGFLLTDSLQTVTIHFDGSDLATGVYTDTLYINSGDPVNPQISVPLTLIVEPALVVGVNELVLVNIRTGEELYVIQDSQLLDVAHPGFYDYGIMAKTNGDVQQVSFSLDGELVNIDKSAPYALATLTLAQLSKGQYQFSAQGYASEGMLGEAQQVVVTVFNSALVSGLEVVNPLGEVLTSLHNGDTINIADGAYTQINLKALVGERGVGSVKFYLNGEHVETDNVAPYSLAGDLLGYFYQSWKAKPGHYQLRVVPYSLPYGVGVMGQAFTVDFNVVDGQPSGSQAGGSQPVAGQVELSLYPNPAAGELNISLEGAKATQVEVQLRNAQGQLLYSESLEAKALQGHRLSLQGLHLLPGLYYVQVVGEKGTIQAKKFIKR
jgi:subtilisin family serine protease